MAGLTVAQRIFCGVVIIHLILVSLFIWTNFPGDSDNFASRALRTYKNLSGCFRDYSFFAPLVASDLRAGFYLEEGNNKSFISFTAPNQEIGFRYNCIIASCMRDARGRDLFTQSWAATIFGEYPNATTVRVVTEAFEVPTMEEYRQGKTPEWVLVYYGDFNRE